MKFLTKIIVTAGHDISRMAVEFEAPTWEAARLFEAVLLQQLGINRKDVSTETTYAPKARTVRTRPSDARVIEGENYIANGQPTPYVDQYWLEG